MRLSALLLLLLFTATARADRSFTLLGLLELVDGLTIVLCSGYTVTHYADGVLQIVPCPPKRARVNMENCRAPSLVTLAPNSYHLNC